LAESLQAILEKQELFAKVIEFFPYPIQVFSLDGTARLINKAALEMIGIKSIGSHVGKYNEFKDPILQKLGVMKQVKQVLTGKTVQLTNFNILYRDLVRHFNVRDRNIQAISTDITCFPVLNANGAVIYFAAVFLFKKVYQGREEIGRAKQYIESHWQEPFDLNGMAKAAYLSRAQCIKLFKKHTGITPHEYYINYKISQLKKKLRDTNLSVSQAFTARNMDYNGYSVKIFKERVGINPSEYRKMSLQGEQESGNSP
jgi:AraC family transcriptional regulator